uniref:GLTP domain-containing protein n=1 Tax=Caenorhabditis tropicalis TaxID=1561998 RepID=A0A1I7T7C7_9PELO
MLELLSEMVTAYNGGLPHNKTEDLSGAVATAYAKSLKRHHGFIAKQAFKVVTMAVPYRHTILKAVALGQEGLDDVCIRHIECHLDNFRLNVKTLVDYYIAKKLDTPDP